MGLKIGGLSLPKLADVNEVAELAIKARMPLNQLTVGAKIAENILQGLLRKDSINRSYDAMLKQNPVSPLPIKPE